MILKFISFGNKMMEFIPLRLKGTSGRILDSRRNFFTERWSGTGRRGGVPKKQLNVELSYYGRVQSKAGLDPGGLFQPAAILGF